MKVTFSALIAFLLASCSKGTDSDLELTLLTDSIVCVGNLDKKRLYDIDTAEYNKLSQNILHYRLTNTSDKKYFIVVDENEVDTQENMLFMGRIQKRQGTVAGVAFNLYKEGNVLTGISTMTTGGDYSTDKDYYTSPVYIQRYNDSVFIHSAAKRRLFNGSMRNAYGLKRAYEHGFVIYPGQTKYFSSEIKLPLRNDQYWYSDVASQIPDSAAVEIINVGKYTKSSLSADQKKEVAENNYTLFDGRIISNKVPVKMVSMKDQ